MSDEDDDNNRGPRGYRPRVGDAAPPIPPNVERMLLEAQLEIARLNGYIQRVKETDQPPRAELVRVSSEDGIGPDEMLDRIDRKLRNTSQERLDAVLGKLTPEELDLLLRQYSGPDVVRSMPWRPM